jgi:glycine oxidase
MRTLTIIGGGVIGLSIAYRCAKRGVSVTLLEKNTLGSGATLSSLGALWPPRASRRSALQRLQLKSLWMFEDFVREIEAASGFKISFHRHGHLELLTSEAAAEDAARDVAAASDWPTFGRPAAQVLIPATGELPSFGIPPFELAPLRFAVLHSHVSAQVRVAEYVVALRAACEKLGVSIRENFAVTDLGNVPAADATLVTAGAWTKVLTRSAPTFPVKGQAIEIESPGELPQVILKCGAVYIIPWVIEGKHRALIGATTEKEAGFDMTVGRFEPGQLFEDACGILPLLRQASIIRRWAGLRPGAPKGRPIMGKIPGTANQFVCAGHYKTGIGLSPLVSQQMTQLLFGEEVDADFSTFAPK